MKKIENISAIVLATVFLWASNGVNIINYCCNQCKDKGIEVFVSGCGHHNFPVSGCNIEETSTCCCSVLSSDYIAKSKDIEPYIESDDDYAHKCQLKRYTLDYGQQVSTNVFIQNKVFAFVMRNFSTSLAYHFTTLNKNFPSTGYVFDSKRTLLSHICVLII